MDELIPTLRIESPKGVSETAARLRPPAEAVSGVSEAVGAILSDVRRRGDDALVEQVRRHDWRCAGPECLRVPGEALAAALERSDPELVAALRAAADSIRRFHEGQRPGRCRPLREEGMRAGLRTMPLASVGLYVPGGRAAYPSTLLMLAVPARVAGVRRIAVASPAGRGGLPKASVLAASALLGIGEVYAVGGAAAVGALAFGTASIPRVDKIFGPGNAYVAEAKRRVFGEVGIDSVAGPTELVILSDGTGRPDLLAADLLAQAEHDPEASAVLLTTDPAEIPRVRSALEEQIPSSPRAAIQRGSLRARGALVLCADAATACATAEALAPEHLSVQTRNPRRWARAVPSAAAVFLGPYTPEAAGDYGAGPNHSLPTGGTARFASPVTVWDFLRHQSYLEMDRRSLERRAPWMEALAAAEGLDAHARSIAARRALP